MIYIYCLKDPDTDLIRYVGKTKTPLHNRLRLHIVESRKNKKSTRKQKWILDLLYQNKKPKIECIDLATEANWREIERYWIARGKELGWPLLNLKRGGDGYDNLTHSEEFKKALSNRMKNNTYGKNKKWTPEQRMLLMNSRKTPWNKAKKGTLQHSNSWKKEASKRMRNENHPMVRLKDSDILLIRQKYKEGTSAKELSKQFNIDYSYILKLIKNKNRILCVQ